MSGTPEVYKLTSGTIRRPAGLVLAGGGALGAWQAGALGALIRGGLQFDHVFGFSSGSLNGLLYFLGREREFESSWRGLDGKVFRWELGLAPLSLFSEKPLRSRLFFALDDPKTRAFARCTFTVAVLCLNDGMPIYARFSPPGKGAWDSPLASWIAASCAIPYIFPPVSLHIRGETKTLVDGGVPGREWMRFDSLAGCEDVVVLELVRADEVGRKPWGPVAKLDQKSREIVRRQIDSGVASLAQLKKPPRVFRLAPSQRLDYYQLSFRDAHCAPAYALGASDAADFLKSFEAGKTG